MARGALAFPVFPERAKPTSDASPSGSRRSRRGLGIQAILGGTLERVYWQQTPMGDFVVADIEFTKGSLGEAFGSAARKPPPWAGSSPRR